MNLDGLRETLLEEAARSADVVSHGSRMSGVRAHVEQLRGARRRRRLGAAAAVLGAAAVTVAVLTVGGLASSRTAGVPAGPSATPPTTVTDAAPLEGSNPSDVYEDVAAALADSGLALEEPLRWGSTSGSLFAGEVPGAPETGVPATGLAGTGYLPAFGAELTVTSFRLEQPVPAAPDLCSWPEFATAGGRCEQGQGAGGVTVTRETPQLGVTSAAWMSGRQVVVVSSHTSALPAASDVEDPHPVEPNRLAQLAQDPRLRW